MASSFIDRETNQGSPQIKGEVKTYKKNQFNTTEGGLYLGHSMANNAKMAVMLRRIFPSPFKRAQYIGLQQGGQLDGSILCSAPSVFEINCGEAPVQDVAGVWYAENGDINIHAPKGRIRLSAQSIDLITTGVAKADEEGTGWIGMNSNVGFKVTAGKIEMESKDAFSMQAETMDLNTRGKCQFDVGSWKLIEGADFFKMPGTGNITIQQHVKAFMKLIGSLK